MNAREIKDIAISLGAEQCGIANVERFAGAPEGFHPEDIYRDCKSVIVFIKSLPHEIAKSGSTIPYAHFSGITFTELDTIGLQLSRVLEGQGIGAVPVPCDTPYEYWDADKLKGMGILSMRHAGYFAGLGILGKSTLLINKKFGNMIYIGAVLINLAVEPDPLVTDLKCPENCRICIDGCPSKAIGEASVDQFKCRNTAVAKVGRGYEVYICNKCRANCAMSRGKK